MGSEPKYINIHSHSSGDESQVLTIRSLFHNENPDDFNESLFSIGLHPWHISNTDIQLAIKLVKERSGDERIIAIGEAGLDRTIETKMDFQQEVLKQHLDIAEWRDKPLIIHCVRAFPEVRKLIRQSHRMRYRAIR